MRPPLRALPGRGAPRPRRARGWTWLAAIDGVLDDDAIVVGDSAMCCYYGALGGLPAQRPRSFLHPTGFGTLGYAVPAAIGATLACPDRRVLALSGDGGLMFTLPELASAAALGIPLPVVVFLNEGYGEIRNEMVEAGFAPVGVDLPAARPPRRRARARLRRDARRPPRRARRRELERRVRAPRADRDHGARGSPGVTKPPYMTVTWNDPVSGRPGYLVIDRLIDGASGGGLRMRAGCTVEEVADLARAMSLKEAVAYDPGDRYTPFGGAKGGIDCDPYDPDAFGVLRRYVEAMRPVPRAPLGDRRGLRPAPGDDRRGRRRRPGCAPRSTPRCCGSTTPTRGWQRLRAAFAVDVDGIGLGEVVGGYGVAQAALAALERLALAPARHACGRPGLRVDGRRDGALPRARGRARGRDRRPRTG